jgi:hypothetical protein
MGTVDRGCTWSRLNDHFEAAPLGQGRESAVHFSQRKSIADDP